MIKSQPLYQLSYTPATRLLWGFSGKRKARTRKELARTNRVCDAPSPIKNPITDLRTSTRGVASARQCLASPP